MKFKKIWCLICGKIIHLNLLNQPKLILSLKIKLKILFKKKVMVNFQIRFSQWSN